MQLKFSPPATTSKVRFFPSEAAFVKAFSAAGAPALWDQGAPIPTSLGRDRLELIPGGEKIKSWDELGLRLAALAARKQERSRPLLVVGGGATLDLGAFVASLYRRGIPLVMVPTTLLGMVDASLGGKTAVDVALPSGLLKNFAGTFYPAREVWIAPHFLHSLPIAERLSGAGECWKTLWLAGGKTGDEALFEFIETGTAGKGLQKIIERCLAAKIRIVQKDPLDTKRVREQLNFGHTVGHVIESGISHGEAVLWGMAVETMLLGKRGEKMLKEILRVLRRLQLELAPGMIEPEEKIVDRLLGDKKVKNGKVELSLLSAPGKIVKLKKSPAEIAAGIRAFPEFYRRA